MLRSLASNMLTVLIFGFFLIGAVGIWGKSQYVAEGPLQNAICFKVKSGTSMRTVVQDLLNDRAISSGLAWNPVACLEKSKLEVF